MDQARTAGLDRVAHARDLVTTEIVKNDNIAGASCRRDHLLDVAAENVATTPQKATENRTVI